MEREQVRTSDPQVVAYLEKDIVRNALDIWYLLNSDKRHTFFVRRENGIIKAHLSLYDTPEAVYSSLGGEYDAARSLISLVPNKAVLTTAKCLGELVKRNLKWQAVYTNDFMTLRRGQEKLKEPDLAMRLSTKDESEYSSFGSSFNVHSMPREWSREQLERNVIFGVFADGKLASVSSLVVWLPKVSVIMGVETKSEFRRRGFASVAVSATVREGLARSESCSLFVRSDNESAIRLYDSLGFKKEADEFWFDLGTGLIP